MIRVVIENVILFLLPTILYVSYLYVTRRGTDAEGQILEDTPLVWLAAAGALLVIITLIAFGSTVGGDPSQGYKPPVMRDGRIEPGKIQ